MAIRGNPTVSARIDKDSRKALAFLCAIDEVDTTAFVSKAVREAIAARLDQLAHTARRGRPRDSAGFNVNILHDAEPALAPMPTAGGRYEACGG